MTKTTQSRRQFLASSAIGAMAAGGAGALLPKQTSATSKLPGSSPLAARGNKLSVAGYSYRSLLNIDDPKLTMEEFFDDCAAMGVEGVEPTSYYFAEDVSIADMRNTKAEAFRRGLDISGTAIRCDFCFPVGSKRAQEVAHVKRWIELADAMDAPTIRIFSGGIKSDQSEEEAYQLAVDGINECCEYAGKYGVILGLENHGGLSATAENLLQFRADVPSPWFGINLDTGNFHSADVYGDLAKVAPHACNVQFKVSIQQEGESKQPADMERIAKILADAGYPGYVVLEFEEPGDPREHCPKLIEQMRAAFQ